MISHTRSRYSRSACLHSRNAAPIWAGFRYTGGGANGHGWTADLLNIKAKIEAECKICFDRVLLNYYRDGNDSVAWHSDNLPPDGKHHPIASVTFGETRVFKVRHKSNKNTPTLDIPLTHGSFLLMGDTMQQHYEQHIPKTTRSVACRINLTFRISEPAKPIYFAGQTVP
jgi:alkylated DNA repair dioxygenase AlkB